MLKVLVDRYGTKYLGLLYYAQLKIDFFDLLNMPLVSALKSNQKITKSTVKFIEFGLHQEQWIKALLEGYCWIQLEAEKGDIYQTYLPVNLHAGSKIKWFTASDGSKVRESNDLGFPHHTIPLSWALFDIIEGRDYSKKGRLSRWDKNVGECEYIHFDTSFKILHYQDQARYLAFNKPFQYALEKWNGKPNEWVEFSTIDLLLRLINYRFVEGKRRTELFQALNLRFIPTTKKPIEKYTA
jgi:hypothetical protein